MSLDAPSFREATVADAPTLAGMHVASWLETYAGIMPDAVLAAQSVPRRTAAWESILRDPSKHDHSVVYLAHVGDVLAGFGGCSEQRDVGLKGQGFEGEINALYVLRRFQQRGIGRALMSLLATNLRGRGFEGVALWVLRSNDVARRFYERCGGQVVGEKKDTRGDVVLEEVAYGWPTIKVPRERLQ